MTAGTAMDPRAAWRWLRALRAPFFTASILPVLLGAALAWRDTGLLDLALLGWALLGVVALHAGANVANDYYDHLSGNDAGNTEFVRPFTGGCRLIQEGILAPRQTLALALGCLAVGAAAGLYLAWRVGWPILGLGAAGLLGGFFYSAPPARLMARGWGEPLIALLFGCLPVLGTYYVLTRHWSGAALAASLPLAVLILMVVLINEFPDARADAAAGRRNWTVRLGRRRAAGLCLALLALWPLPILGLILAGRMPVALAWALVPGLLAAPIARRLRRCYDQPRALAPAMALTLVLHLAVGAAMVAALAWA